MISDDDEDQLYDNESDLDFLYMQMQCKKKYHEAGVRVLDRVIKKLNTSKDGKKKKKFNFLRLHQNVGDARNVKELG